MIWYMIKSILVYVLNNYMKWNNEKWFGNLWILSLDLTQSPETREISFLIVYSSFSSLSRIIPREHIL